MKPVDQSTETVIRVRSTPGGEDAYGDPIEGTTDELPVDGCLVAMIRSTEPTERGQAGAVTGWTVFAPAGSVFARTDQLRIRGVLCDVDGEVADWGDAGVVVNAQRAEG